jgi:glycosyltransferase involved in cell wall biosynthesis
MSRVKLSIIIPSYNSGKTIKKSLEALENQIGQEDFEVIVVDSSGFETAEIVAQQFPKVKLFIFSERKYPGDAINYGISKARGGILALLGADCIADQDWVGEIVKAHQLEYPVIGGTVDNGNPESYVGWGYYFCEFSQWMPQSSKRQMNDACCLSMKRWAFDRYGPFLEGTYCSDTVFNWKLRKDGYKPLFVPSIKISHINIDSLKGFLKHELIHGKSFAKVRVLEQKFSIWQRAVFILISPLLPILLFYRTVRRVFKNRIYLKQFLCSFPLVFLGLSAWSFGEFLGYNSKSKK